MKLFKICILNSVTHRLSNRFSTHDTGAILLTRNQIRINHWNHRNHGKCRVFSLTGIGAIFITRKEGKTQEFFSIGFHNSINHQVWIAIPLQYFSSIEVPASDIRAFHHSLFTIVPANST